ncbi:Membrane-anchored ribosome-binding protein, inhibits growth in stationary phase, ElaB/YqjD/DUF883 family [Palleronia marisminoris]|uniref:DUF883 domain-containing protein n=1 Tax=Palleronia marisminoris TaxID=315423 RepID=A0A1Y5SWP4_9RHOB|nr:Membrane-anchored ribosome-binding protein, inhibits growth in stationary phase, ElaB/YqjD/DUF883 family [Palleronia marisminoris]SLN50239.1 hypothetical protein PAM7066_02258 [Palleronia marisminoris]
MVRPVTSEDMDPTTRNPTTEDLARQVDALKADISRLTESLGEFGKAKSQQYRTEAQRRAEGLRDQAQGRMDEVEVYVRQNPTQALGIAAGVGLLIGLFSRR